MSHVAASYQAMTVIAEHYRRISGLMRSEFGITYTDLLALTTLLERTASVPTPWLSDYLMLDRKTIWNVLLKLEDLGYVSKTASPDDGRTMLLRLSASGNQAAEDIHRRLSAFIREQFLANLHEDEYFDFMRDTSKKAVDILRGHLVQPSLEESEERPLYGSSHIILWRSLIHQWRTTLRSHHGPSLGAFRILDFLAQEGETGPSTLADTLCLPRSNTTSYLQQLTQNGLLCQVPHSQDGRQKNIVITRRGIQEAHRLRSAIEKVAEAAHCSLSPEGQLVVDAWYLRMYANLSHSSK